MSVRPLIVAAVLALPAMARDPEPGGEELGSEEPTGEELDEIDFADDDEGDEMDLDSEDFFSLDAVFVSRFGAESEDVKPLAEAVRRQLEERIAESHLVVDIGEIEPFEDYSAAVYLEACPDTELVGCAFVLGERASADWALMGTVRANGDVVVDLMELEEGEAPPDVPLDLSVSYIDVRESRVLLSFDVTMDETNEEQVLTGIVDVLGKIVDGAAEIEDMRGDLEDPDAQKKRWEAEAEIAAQALSELEDELGVLAREDLERIEAPRLTRSDLSEYEERDDVAPWQRFDMTQGEYIRFRNSQKTVQEWNELKRDRSLQFLIRVEGLFGAGPFNEVYDGRWALDNQTLQVIETEYYQELVPGSTMAANVEVGFGILPYLDAGAFIGSRSARYDYLFYKEVEGQADTVPEPDSDIRQTLQVGGRATFAPMPTYPVRPTLTAGVMFWKGSRIDAIIDPSSVPVEPLPAPTLLLVQGAPGVEARLSDALVAYGRFQVSIPVAGDRVQTGRSGVATLQNRSSPSGEEGLGLEGVVGLQIRVDPFGGGNKSRRYRR